MIAVTLIVSFLYCYLIITIYSEWEATESGQIPEAWTPTQGISVIIVARNEADNIEACIKSILDNPFPNQLLEIILVDDHSEDETASLAQKMSPLVKVIPLTTTDTINSYKKEGIKLGLKQAKFDLILHTDADCIVPKNWLLLSSYNFKTKDIKFQTGAISFFPLSKFLHWFQQLDMFAMMGTTLAGIQSKNWYLANGANMAYLKSDLPKDMFEESSKLASGDDVFLINKMAEKFPGQIYFEKGLLVKTKALDGMTELIQQRIRWAGKNRLLWKGKMKNILLMPVIQNLWILILLIYAIMYGIMGLNLLLLALMVKGFYDYILLRKVSEDLFQEQKLPYFLLSLFVYPIYFVGIGIVSLFKKDYVWKKRRVN